MYGKRVRKPPSQKTVRDWVEQADRCRAPGDYRRAERLYQKALVASEQTFGRDAVEVAVLRNSLGVACKYSGRFREAGRHYRRALVIFEKALGRAHPHSRVCRENLAQLPVLPK
jgi:tetratricopeptide (TPR) repeat protein